MSNTNEYRNSGTYFPESAEEAPELPRDFTLPYEGRFDPLLFDKKMKKHHKAMKKIKKRDEAMMDTVNVLQDQVDRLTQMVRALSAQYTRLKRQFDVYMAYDQEPSGSAFGLTNGQMRRMLRSIAEDDSILYMDCPEMVEVNPPRKKGKHHAFS